MKEMVRCAFHFDDPHVKWIPNHQKNLNKIQVWHQIYSKCGCRIKLMPALWKATVTYMQTTSKVYNNKEFHLHLKEILDIQLLLSRIKLVIYNSHYFTEFTMQSYISKTFWHFGTESYTLTHFSCLCLHY